MPTTMRSNSPAFSSVPKPLRPGERATLIGVEVEVLGVNCGPDARTGLLAQVRRQEATHEVSLAELRFTAGSELGLLVAACRRWQGR